MPRNSQTPSQRTKSGPSTSRKRQRNETLTQPTLEQSFNRSQKVIVNLEERVNDCVRYVVYRAGNKLPIRHTDLQKNVLHNVGRNIDKILLESTKILKNVYGYDLYLSDDGTATKQYLVSNNLSYKAGLNNVRANDDEDEDDALVIPDDINKILIMLVLTHIFMSNNIVNEASLFSFLRSVQIDPDEKHELFGNVKDFITTTMIKQKYLRTEVDKHTHKVSYLWGPRAEHEISKHALLNFVCKVYKDRNPKSWSAQFESAVEQANDAEVEANINGEGEEEESS